MSHWTWTKTKSKMIRRIRFYIEFHILSWYLGPNIFLGGNKPMFDVGIGPFSIGLEYRNKEQQRMDRMRALRKS